MKPDGLIRVARKAIQANEPLLIHSEPGVGKTSIIALAAQEEEHDLVVSTPGLDDPTKPGGMPWISPDQKSARFVPYGEVSQLLNCDRPTVWFLDDLGQAPNATQASYMHWILSREVNGMKLPHHVKIMSATNGRGQRAGVNGVIEPFKGRVTILKLEACLRCWTNWALGANVEPEVIQFLNFFEELFHDFQPTADLTNSPSPRGWEGVSRWYSRDLDPEDEEETYAGRVGQGAAGQFANFLKVYRELDNPDAILVDPEHARIPTEPSAMAATSVALSRRASPTNFDRIVTYAQRVAKEMSEDFAVLLIKDCQRQCPEVKSTFGYTKLIQSDLGQQWVA